MKRHLKVKVKVFTFILDGCIYLLVGFHAGPTLPFPSTHCSYSWVDWSNVSKVSCSKKYNHCMVLPFLFNFVIFLKCFYIYSTFSLLDILFGKKEGSGEVRVNGQKQQQNFKFKSGYVVQVCE